MDDLHGRELRNADLHDADLHDADLRGVDLGGADLRGADLRGARMGLSRRAIAVDVAVAAIAAAAGGYAAAWLGETIASALWSPLMERRTAGAVLSSALLLCLGATVVRGTSFAVRFVVLPTMALVAVVAIEVVVMGGRAQGALLALSVVALMALFLVMTVTATLSRAVAAASHPAALALVMLAWLLGARGASGHGLPLLVAVTAAVASSRAKAGSMTSPNISRWAARLGTRGGTSFRGADLREARFTGARLRNVDFRGARLDGVDWDGPVEVDACCFDDLRTAPRRKLSSRWRSTSGSRPT